MSQDADLTRDYRELAGAYAGLGKYPEAEEIYKQIISAAEAKTHDNPALTERDLTQDLGSLARVYSDEHRYDDALDAVKRPATVANPIVDSVAKSQATSAVSVYTWFAPADLAEIYREKGDNAAAEPASQRALEMTEQLKRAAGHSKLAQLLDNYATLLRDEGRFTDAEPLYKRALAVWAKARYPDHPDFGVTLTHYAAFLRKMNRLTGYLIPPVGLNLLMSSYRFKKPVPEVLRSVLPVVLVLTLGVLLITYIPALTTTLPRWFGY
jgi:tetratricopeptide (TPR) repeat protein